MRFFAKQSRAGELEGRDGILLTWARLNRRLDLSI